MGVAISIVRLLHVQKMAFIASETRRSAVSRLALTTEQQCPVG